MGLTQVATGAPASTIRQWSFLRLALANTNNSLAKPSSRSTRGTPANGRDRRSGPRAARGRGSRCFRATSAFWAPDAELGQTGGWCWTWSIGQSGRPMRNTDLGRAAQPEAESEGWLLQQGYTVVSCGWQHNVPAARRALRAACRLKRWTQWPAAQRARCAPSSQVNTPTDTHRRGRRALRVPSTSAYPVADLDERHGHTRTAGLPAGSRPRDSPRPVAFRRASRMASAVPIELHVCTTDSSRARSTRSSTPPGRARHGHWFRGAARLVSFLRFASDPSGQSVRGNARLRAGLRRLADRVACCATCCTWACAPTKHDRLVLDGVMTLIAGPMRTEANWRFGQPSFIGSDSPGFAFPFTDAPQTGPPSGVTDGLLRNGVRGHSRKVMHVNTSAEYANLDRRADPSDPRNGATTRRCPTTCASTSWPGRTTAAVRCRSSNRVFSSVAAYYNNTIDYRPLVRAAFANLDAGRLRGAAPPGEPVPAFFGWHARAARFAAVGNAALPGAGNPPERLYPTQRLDYGPKRPLGAPISCRRPGGYPDLVPAWTRTATRERHAPPERRGPARQDLHGWNPRHPSIGGSEMNLLLNGATIPFAATASTARRRGATSRPSIAERYASREAYPCKRSAAPRKNCAEDRYLLESDIDEVVAPPPVVTTSSFSCNRPLP